MSRVLRFTEGALVAARDPLGVEGSPDLADSFLCQKQQVRGFRYHRARFERDLAECAPGLVEQLDDFFRAVHHELADEPETFPRIDVCDDALWLRVRPAPPLTETLTAVSEHLRREREQIKGPNIGYYAQRNARNQCETLRCDRDGNLLEGVTSALLWWSDTTRADVKTGNAVLHCVASNDRVWSTTEDIVVDIARRLGVGVQTDGAVARDTVTPSALRACEVWAVNALHGIRPVAALDHMVMPLPDTARLERFRTELETTWEPISS